MWMIWALIVFGGVWDAADSFTLRRAERDECIGVRGDNKLSLSKCVAGSDKQTWLWDGKRLKNKLKGKCLVVFDDTEYPNKILECSLPELKGTTKKHHDDFNEDTEFTRTGKHGLKNSKGKCLKFPQNRSDVSFSLGNCTEDKDDPYYE
jgi:hypothetical protein